MTKDFRAARERQLEPTAAPPTTEHDWPEGLGTDPTPPCAPYTSGTPHLHTDASRRRVKLPCGRAVIRLGAVHTARRAPRANSRPGHNPDGDTANHAELVAIHAAIADARKSTSPNRHGLRGGHRPDHQRSAPTGETHLPPPQSPASTHLRPSGKREQTGNKAQSSC
jgi:hypothetical protein